ncbi:MAG: hypothetical protein MRY59_13740 [Aquisalinus sp.]|nr:hypothetical protein [Aquisalinus sp.]
MNSDPTIHFVHDCLVTDDGAVMFKCDTDSTKWPWLSLHPAHSIAVQSVNYFASVGASFVAGRLDPQKWSALTSLQWQTFVHADEALPATHGVMDPQPDPDKADYAISLFNAQGTPVYRFTGVGVVFQNRDFKSWRAKARAEIMALPEPDTFRYAAPEAVGALHPVESFVTELIEKKDISIVRALVTSATGFMPSHPYHDGSGDHVNAGHLCDAAQQAAHMLRHQTGKNAAYPVAGRVNFKRYVELDRPFEIRLENHLTEADRISMSFWQGEYHCADLVLQY